MSDSVIEIKGLWKSFKSQAALKRLDLRVPKEVFSASWAATEREDYDHQDFDGDVESG